MMSETKFKTFCMQIWWLTTKFWAPLILHLLGSLLRTVLTLFRQPTAPHFQNHSLRFVQYSIDNYMESFAFHIKGVKADLQFVYQILEVKFVKPDKILRFTTILRKVFLRQKNSHELNMTSRGANDKNVMLYRFWNNKLSLNVLLYYDWT